MQTWRQQTFNKRRKKSINIIFEKRKLQKSGVNVGNAQQPQVKKYTKKIAEKTPKLYVHRKNANFKFYPKVSVTYASPSKEGS